MTATVRRIARAEALRRLSIRFPAGMLARLDRAAARLGVARGTLITHLLAQRLGDEATLARTRLALARGVPRPAPETIYYGLFESSISIPESLHERLVAAVKRGGAGRSRPDAVLKILNEAIPAGGEEAPIDAQTG